MGSVIVTLPDGSTKDFEKGTLVSDVAKSINKKLYKTAVCAKLAGTMVDIDTPLTENASLEFYTGDSPEGLEVLRHSTAHVLAMAVQKIWPKTQVTIGPVIKDGFYYDFSFEEDVKLSEKDFIKIEKEMTRIMKASVPIKREEMSRNDCVQKFEGIREHFKVEIIKDIPENETLSVYSIGEWFDLCRGPHIKNTSKVGAFKLTKVAGAYWRGDETKEMLTRIYGTAWKDKADLDDYLYRLEEAKKRDHRVIGKQLDLFSFHKESPANPFFHPKGAFIYNKLMDVARNSNNHYGFSEISTPLVMSVDMWHKSGHYENYREDMFFTKTSDLDAAVKPMNCPGHCLVYSSNHHSYRDLPLKLSEFGRVHRNERSGVTHGLFRVRGFVQDDAHIFCTPEQISKEIGLVIEQIIRTYKVLGFSKVKMELSTRPEKSIGSDEIWENAESALEGVLTSNGYDFTLNPGDGAFYGPKIDFHLIDSLERSWQCGTVQLDFSMPERFELDYVDADDVKQTPVMIHRAVLGSLERFLGIFIEHHSGHFPLWACPVQVKILNVSKAQDEYSELVYRQLKSFGIRAELDLRNEKLGFKIREAQLQKSPYMIIIGDNEVSEKKISPRKSNGTQLDPMTVDDFYALVKEDVLLPEF